METIGFEGSRCGLKLAADRPSRADVVTTSSLHSCVAAEPEEPEESGPV